MRCRMLGPWLATGLVLFSAQPAGAQESAAPATPIVLQNELPSTGTYATGEQAKAAASARKLTSERNVEMWSIALIGPAAMLFIVTVLGLTITVRSLRDDFRRERNLNRSWQHDAWSRAKHSHD